MPSSDAAAVPADPADPAHAGIVRPRDVSFARRLAREVVKYWAVFSIELRQLTAYTWDFVLGNATIVVSFYVLFQVWKVTVSPEAVPSLPGESMTWNELIWFLAGAQILFFGVDTGAQLTIEHDVISGNIAVTLARPYDYLLARMATVIANIVLAFAVAFPAGFVIAWISTGTVIVTPLSVAAFLIAFILRTFLYFTLQAIAGLATFWIEKATVFVWILGLMILTFGGGAVPIGYWPEWAQQAIEFTPFPALMYYPAKLFIRWDLDLFLAMLLRVAIWLVVLGGIVILIYRRALRRLDINGG